MRWFLICRLSTKKCGHFNITEQCAQCSCLKDKWDKRLALNDFEDAEQNELLKKWSGAHNSIDSAKVQEPNKPIQNTWPEINFAIEEDLFNNPALESMCESLSKHGNNSVTAKKMIAIFRSHCDGLSSRKIGVLHKVHHVTAIRVIWKLKELSRLWK